MIDLHFSYIDGYALLQATFLSGLGLWMTLYMLPNDELDNGDYLFLGVIWLFVYFKNAKFEEKEEKKEIIKKKKMIKLNKKAIEINNISMIQGPDVDLNIFEENDKIEGFILLLWATWCGHSKQALVPFNEIFKEYSDKGFIFLALSNEQPDKIKDFISRFPREIGFYIGSDHKNEGQIVKKYQNLVNKSVYPHAFLINKKKEIIWDGHPVHLGRAIFSIIPDSDSDSDSDLEKKDNIKEDN